MEEENCKGCGACCMGSMKGRTPLTKEDIDRLTKHFPLGYFMRQGWLDQKPNGDCIFLTKNKECAIYEIRPQFCRNYPERLCQEAIRLANKMVLK